MLMHMLTRLWKMSFIDDPKELCEAGSGHFRKVSISPNETFERLLLLKAVIRIPNHLITGKRPPG